MDGRGQFGDQFGAFNAFVSMLTVVAVLGSIWLQRIQHREEMRAARDQHEAQMADAERKHAEQMRGVDRSRARDLMFRLFDRRLEIQGSVRWIVWDQGEVAGADAVEIIIRRIYETMTCDNLSINPLAKDVGPDRYKPGSLDEGMTTTQERHTARYAFAWGITKLAIGEYLRALISIASAAKRAKDDGDEHLAEVARDMLSVTDLFLLEMHSLTFPPTSALLRELGWRLLYERYQWNYPAPETPSAPAGAGAQGEI